MHNHIKDLRDSVSLRHPRAVVLEAHFGISRTLEKLEGTTQLVVLFVVIDKRIGKIQSFPAEDERSP